MSSVHDEIGELEERFRLAELGPDPKFFEEVLDDNLVLVAGWPGFFAKSSRRSASARKSIEVHSCGNERDDDCGSWPRSDGHLQRNL